VERSGVATRLLLTAMLALLAGCAARQPALPQTDAPLRVIETDARNVPLTGAEQDAERRASLRLQLAVGYYERRQFDVALDEVARALAAKPDLADAYAMRALIYMEKGEDAAAEASFKEALARSQGNPGYLNNYGWFLCQHGREAESIAYFDKALAARNYDAPSRALANAGVCSFRLKQAESAERYLRQALQFEPDNPLANAFLALIYARSNDTTRANFHISQIVAGQPLSALVLWTIVRAEHQLGNTAQEEVYARRLAQQYPASPEILAYRRGEFGE